ncbi:MAG: hypothetical protein RhofKO_31650 [Rhodothermales bacterium]
MTDALPIRLRPRFERITPHTPSEVLTQLRAALDAPNAPCYGNIFGDHAVLHVLHTDEHIWSPFLSLDVACHPEGTRVRGIFGPKPAVWSLFVAAYAICLFGALFAAAFAYAQSSLGQPAWALSGIALAGVGALVTWGFARYGQHLGREQMILLRRFLDEVLGHR